MAKQTKVSSFFSLSEGALPERKRVVSENRPGESKHRKTGIDPQWKLDFPWLQVSVADSGEAMLCSLCIKHNSRPKRCIPGKAVWVDTPC